MKINFVTSNLAPFRIDLLDELCKYIDITIFYNDDVVKNTNSKYMNRKPTKSKYINISRYIKNNIRFFDYRKILNTPCDLIILDGYGFLSQIIFIILLKIKKIKFVLSVDGGFIKKDESKIKYFFKKYLISSAEYYLSTSNVTDEFLIYYGAEKNKIYRHYFTSIYKKDIKLVPECQELRKELRKELNLKDKITIISVGKFIYGKGFDLLIKSLKYINANVEVLIIGGNKIDEYSKLIEDEHLNNVKFIGFCDKEILKKYYDASDIFILPTRSDVWGLVVNEAMSRGLPVITTDMCIAGLSLIENYKNGMIVSVDEKSIAEGINKLLEIDLHTIGKNNIDKIKKYTIEESALNDYIVLKKILNLKDETNEN